MKCESTKNIGRVNMEKHKILILTQTVPDDYVLLEWKKNGYNADIIYKDVNLILRLIRRILIKLNVSLCAFWYGDWKNLALEANMVIVHISPVALNVCKYINLINPKAKVIAWYWNKVNSNMLPDNIKGECDKWSFDFLNCKKYGLRFNHQYYFKSFIINNNNKELWDIYFIGHDHNRAEEIIKIYDYCCKEGIHTKFQIVSPEKKSIVPNEIVAECDIKYDEIRKDIASSKAILEILQNGQSGPTLRTMEAIFFQKRLITNNQYIINEKFYSEDNIFVLGKRPIYELKDFLMKDFAGYDERFIELYDIHSWINNFIKDENTI